MFKRLLVPTDGSPLSVRAFALTETLARAQAAEVILAQVVEAPPWMGLGPDANMDAEVYQQLVDDLDQTATAHLARAQARLAEVGVRSRTALLHGFPAAELLEYEEASDSDLVVMSTHGRTGLARFALGSIADTLLREGTAPVLLVRAFAPALCALESALVPLDGSPLAEQALPAVRSLAQRPLRKVELLRVIQRPEERSAASDYLERIAPGLREYGLQVEISIREGFPSDIIRGAAAGVNLVVLGTHGRGGFDRLRHGSVADRAMRELATPVLLIRAKAERLPQEQGERSRIAIV
jgi:nucleotide-binding universal stress UspA family protein